MSSLPPDSFLSAIDSKTTWVLEFLTNKVHLDLEGDADDWVGSTAAVRCHCGMPAGACSRTGGVLTHGLQVWGPSTGIYMKLKANNSRSIESMMTGPRMIVPNEVRALP